VWSDETKSCVLLNPQSNKLNVIVSLVSDTTLLLIMLVGLFRLRFQTREYGFGHILWNQVRWWPFLLADALFANLNFCS
jgi:hypothetical protein